jgi:hypothetical protein
MCARETASKSSRAKSAELPSGVPPLGEVHFANAGNHQPQFQKAIEIHSLTLRSGSWILTNNARSSRARQFGPRDPMLIQRFFSAYSQVSEILRDADH